MKVKNNLCKAPLDVLPGAYQPLSFSYDDVLLLTIPFIS